MSHARTGLRLIRVAIGAVGAFLLAAGAYLTWAALANPDVRLKKPDWVEGAFDHSYWIPVMAVTLGGAVLVGMVMWTAYRRLAAGEDLYEGRMGRGLRRRGERFVEDDEEA